MARNHYEDALGVLSLDWQNVGEYGDVPTVAGVIVVEVWRSSLNFYEPLRPKALVEAKYELWAHRHVTGWHRIRSNGDLEPIATFPKVRRWASFLDTRSWAANVVLDGWNGQ